MIVFGFRKTVPWWIFPLKMISAYRKTRKNRIFFQQKYCWKLNKIFFLTLFFCLFLCPQSFFAVLIFLKKAINKWNVFKYQPKATCKCLSPKIKNKIKSFFLISYKKCQKPMNTSQMKFLYKINNVIKKRIQKM